MIHVKDFHSSMIVCSNRKKSQSKTCVCRLGTSCTIERWNQNNPSIVHPIPSDSIKYHQPSLSLWDANLQGHLWLLHGPGESRNTTWSCYNSKRRFHNQTTKTYDQKLRQMICFTPCTAKTFMFLLDLIYWTHLHILYFHIILPWFFSDGFFQSSPCSWLSASCNSKSKTASVRSRSPKPKAKTLPWAAWRWDFLGIPQKLVKFTTGKTYDWLY